MPPRDPYAPVHSHDLHWCQNKCFTNSKLKNILAHVRKICLREVKCVCNRLNPVEMYIFYTFLLCVFWWVYRFWLIRRLPTLTGQTVGSFRKGLITLPKAIAEKYKYMCKLLLLYKRD
jgi:hypothetical protein